MHFFDKKKYQDSSRIKRVSKKESLLLKRATEIPSADIKQKSLELEAVSKVTLPLLAEDEREEFLEAIKVYLGIYSQVGGVFTLSLDDLEKRVKMNREFQFRKQLLQSSFLKKDFSDDLGLFENDFYELFSEYLLTGEINTDVVSFDFNKKGIAKLKTSWDKILRLEESEALKRSQASEQIANEKIFTELTKYLTQKDSEIDLDPFLQINSLLLDQFKINLLDEISKENEFDQLIVLFINQAGEFLIDPAQAVSYLETVYFEFKNEALKEELRAYIFYSYYKKRDYLLESESLINFYLNKARERELKAGRILKRKNEE